MSSQHIKKCFKWLPLILLISGLFSFFYFGFYQYLTFGNLKSEYQQILQWTAGNYVQASVVFIAIYSLTVAMSIPGNWFFSMTGGWLFGITTGLVYATLSVVIGSILCFLAIKISFAEWFAQRYGARIKKMEAGFQENAFNYILTLRLIPIVPFWLINVVSAIFKVRLFIFSSATALGVIPALLVYVILGNHLEKVLASNQTPHIGLLFQPAVLAPLLGLALLAFLPIFVRFWRRRQSFSF